MLGVMLQKLWHKKWMVACLLIGSILLIATVVSFPMYRSAAFDRMLRDEFAQELTETGKWQGIMELVTVSNLHESDNVLAGMEEFVAQLYSKLAVTEKETVTYYYSNNLKATSLMLRQDLKDAYVRLTMLSDLPEHVQMLAGEMYSEDGLSEDGCIEVIISQECLTNSKLLLGETLEFANLEDAEGKPVRIKVTGVFDTQEDDSFYWQVTAAERSLSCFMNEQLFREMFTGDNEGTIKLAGKYFAMFEYKDMKASKVDELYNGTKQLLESEEYGNIVKKAEYTELIESFEKKKNRIQVTLFILQVPVLILLCAFLFMISSQMYDMERNEISVLKSRGSSRGQIFKLYLYQSIFLSLTGTLFGIPLGIVFCRMLGSTQNFLEFDIRRQLDVTYGWDVLLYTLAAIGGSILIMTIPALKHSRLSIVNLKQQKAIKKRSWWEKVFLDIICLAVGIYGYYNYSTNKSVMEEAVMRGEALDPLLYFSSSMFIVGAGLLFLRLQPVLVKVIYFLGKNFWEPASYASFMENIKNGRKQQFIMLFLILTISLGMYHATVARTILQNALDNASYLDGADVIIKEVWQSNPLYELDDGDSGSQYIEPDYFKYSLLESVDSYTKVLYDGSGYITQGKNGRISTTVMGIHTKEFGETTEISDELLEKPYYEYLNELAVVPEGILVSRNFQTVQEYKVGDKITYYDSLGRSYSGEILDFFDYWPGYEPETMSLNTDGGISTKENYMVVANYSILIQKWGSIPYEVWLSMDEEYSTDEEAGNNELYQWIKDNDIQLRKYVNRQDDREKVMEDPLLQGTNGVLTMGFIVMMILCAVGYMIYWIMSIRAREMMFGVLRACGMHKNELFHMLMNEQIFSGAFSVFAGIVIGKCASELYVPILQTAYAASNQVLPMELIVNQADMARLYGVIIGAMAICLLVIIMIVYKLNVTKALKLGEE